MIKVQYISDKLSVVMIHYLVKERIKASSTCLSFASCFCPVSRLDLSKGQGNALNVI